jgi:S1-C subfamily serine protease
MTNAHVVAGTHGDLQVITKDGRRYRATVVLYDPRRDLAVLRVPGLVAPALTFNFGAHSGDSAVITGFTKDEKSLSTELARIRAEQKAEGPDIHHAGLVVRRIYTLSGKVAPGVPGAPLLAIDGTVYGVVFGSDVDNPNAGYALTATEVASTAKEGQTTTRPVPTPRCSD